MIHIHSRPGIHYYSSWSVPFCRAMLAHAALQGASTSGEDVSGKGGLGLGSLNALEPGVNPNAMPFLPPQGT